MTTPSYAEDLGFDYVSLRGRDRRTSDRVSQRTPESRSIRAHRSPAQVNGIHRRRNKRFAW